MLLKALEHPASSPHRPLPPTLLPSVTTTLSSLHTHLSSIEEERTCEYFSIFQHLLHVLRTKFNSTYKPPLDAVATLVAVVLPSSSAHPVSIEATHFLYALISSNPNPRKIWDAVVPRLMVVLLKTAFSCSTTTDTVAASAILQVNCKSILDVAIFHHSHIVPITEAAEALLSKGNDDDKEKEEEVDGGSDREHEAKEKKKPKHKSYAFQLFDRLQGLLGLDTRGQTIPWMVHQFASVVATHRQHAEVKEKEDGNEMYGDRRRRQEKEKEQHAMVRSFDGVPVDADFLFFSAVCEAIIAHTLPLRGDDQNNDDNVGIVSSMHMLDVLASVCSCLKPCRIYRPTEDPSGTHREFLGTLISTVLRYAAHPSLTRPLLQVMHAILSVEHRGIHGHLRTLWALLLSGSADQEKEEEDSDSSVRIQAAVGLIHAYAELRQLPALLDTIASVLLDAKENTMIVGAEGAGWLLSTSSLRTSLLHTVASLPSGQLAPLVEAMCRWVEMVQITQPKSALLIADVIDLLAGGVGVGVGHPTAGPVAAVITDVGLPILATMVSDVLINGNGNEKEKERQQEVMLTVGVAVYVAMARLHHRCVLIDPGTRSLFIFDDDSDDDDRMCYFDPLVRYNGTDEVSAVLAMLPTKPVSRASPALGVVCLRAMAHYIEILYARRLSLKYKCRGGGGGSGGDQQWIRAWHLLLGTNEPLLRSITSISAIGTGSSSTANPFLSQMVNVGERRWVEEEMVSCLTTCVLTTLPPFECLDVNLIAHMADVVLMTLMRSGCGPAATSSLLFSAPKFVEAFVLGAVRRVCDLLRVVWSIGVDGDDDNEEEEERARKRMKKKKTKKPPSSNRNQFVHFFDSLDSMRAFDAQKFRAACLQSFTSSSSLKSPATRKEQREAGGLPDWHCQSTISTILSVLASLSLTHPTHTNTATVLAALGVSIAFSYMSCGSISDHVVEALQFAMSCGSQPLSTVVSIPLLGQALLFVRSSHGLGTTTTSSSSPSSINKESGTWVLQQQLSQAMSLVTTHALSTSSSDQDLMRWVETLSFGSGSVDMEGQAVLLEGCLSGIVSLVCPDRGTGWHPPGDALVSVPSSVHLYDMEEVALLLSNIETRLPSTAGLPLLNSTTTTANIEHLYIVACAAHMITLYCRAPPALYDAFSRHRPHPGSNLILSQIPSTTAAVASLLTHSLAMHSSSLSFALTLALTLSLAYVHAVCEATVGMKPAATPTHLAVLVCLLLHALYLLPTIKTETESFNEDCVRRIIPLTAAFPASSHSQIRTQVLDCMRTLVAGLNSHQVRWLLAFVERQLVSQKSGGTYGLALAEMGLMVLEAPRKHAVLETLNHHAERLVTAITRMIVNNGGGGGGGGGSDLWKSLLSTATTTIPKRGEQEKDTNPITTDTDIDSEEEEEEDVTPMDVDRVEREEGERGPPSWLESILALTPIENDTNSSSSQQYTISTALRCLESIVARPKVLKAVSHRHVAQVIHATIYATSSTGSSSSGAADRVTFVNACHVATALLRHRDDAIGRCLPLLCQLMRSLLIMLVRIHPRTGKRSASTHTACVYCAEALASVMTEMAGVRAAEKYCPHILIDYLILAACPITQTSWNMVHASSNNDNQQQRRHHHAASRSLFLSDPVREALRHGAYAVYGACGSAGVQYVYASLGGKGGAGAGGGGGVWRTGLAALKADHDKYFKYTGKV